ncbi:response regulator [candidate division KSB1 bacterium]|nr:response regulator [candidate division KSB1 bacterium]
MRNQKIKILLIEDNPADARLLQETLSDVNQNESINTVFEIQCATRHVEGIEFLNEADYDIVLLDLSLPDSQGLETFTNTHRLFPDIPIIILSGLDDETVALQAVRSGAQDYLFKGEATGYLLLRAIRYAIERKRIVAELKTANKKLQELDHLKSDFLSTVSHELRTPIAIMREGVSLCLDGVAGEINETQKELLSDTQQNIDRLARLVTDLLDISKIEADKIKLRRSAVDMRLITKKVYEYYITQANERKIDFEVELPDQSISLYADEDKMFQIYQNLVSNALRYTESGGKVKISLKENAREIICTVADTGIGIAKGNIGKLFSKFEQFGRLEGPGYKGTGLGLAIAKGLVEKHGGRIWVDSKLGEGTSFYFAMKKLSFPRIHIVDDEIAVVEVIKEFLIEDGYTFITSQNGTDAIEKAQKYNPDMIILDMKLPKMNGYEVVGRLKQDDRTNQIPLLIISAFNVDQKRLEQTDKHYVFPVLYKPFERNHLRIKVKELLSEQFV